MGVGAAVKWGILSTADINRRVIPGAHATEKVELIAVASRDLRRAEEYAHEWEIDRAYGSYEALLEDADVEAVYISLPNMLHCEWSIRAVEAGKHVLCEKPMSRHVGDVESAFDAAERNGRILMEAFMYRHNPQTKRLRQLVDEGVIGDLRLIRSCFSYSLYDAENIRLRTEVEGGSLMDVGCYCVSGSRLLAGEPEQLYGQQFVGPSGTDWVFTGTMRFPGDVFAQFDCGTALPERDELEAIGSDGSLFLDDPWHCDEPLIELRRDAGMERSEVEPADSDRLEIENLSDVGMERIEVEPADSYRLELENLSDAIRGATEPLLGREDAVGQARAIDALYRSAVTGAAVSP